MPFQKGISGFPSGRPKGAKNKPKKALRIRLSDQVENIKQELTAASRKEKSEFLLTISHFILAGEFDHSKPQLQA